MAKITLADGTVIEGTAEELRELAKAFGEVAEETPEDIDLRTKDEAEEATQDIREGDYVVSSVSELGITAGKPYKITTVHSDGDFTFRDDDDDLRFWNVEYDDVTIYRPIEGAPQVGDKILVVDAKRANGYYGNGDILSVADCYFWGTVGKYVVDVDGDGPYLYREEFVIIERAERAGEEATEIEVGDIVRNEGVLYEVIGVREPGYIESEEGVTLKDPERPNGKSWRFAHNCEIVAKASDRKDV